MGSDRAGKKSLPDYEVLYFFNHGTSTRANSAYLFIIQSRKIGRGIVEDHLPKT